MWAVYSAITIYTVSITILSGYSEGRCRLPVEWHGRWYWKQTVLNITASEVGGRGRCVQREFAKHLLQTERDGKPCYICMVIFYQHRNIIEFKESLYCSERLRPLRELCGQISSDAPLHTMVRLHGGDPTDDPLDNRHITTVMAEPCPLIGQYTFTYQRGNRGICGKPLSRLSSCDGRRHGQMLALNQACVDIGGSEQLSERITCLATWSNFRRHYLFARLDSVKTNTDADRYRCYMYRETAPEFFELVQSQDSTCQGLSFQHGYKVYYLTQEHVETRVCSLPSWWGNVERWISMDGSRAYHLYPNNNTIHIYRTSGIDQVDGGEGDVGGDLDGSDDDGVESGEWPVRLGCDGATEQSTSSELELVMRRRRSCLLGYQCLKIAYRHKNVIQIKFGRVTFSRDTACEHFDNSKQYVTLLAVSAAADPQPCPLYGRFSVVTSAQSPARQLYRAGEPLCRHKPAAFSQLESGCGSGGDGFRLTQHCKLNKRQHQLLTTEYKCYAEWRDHYSGDIYVVVAPTSITGSLSSLQPSSSSSPSSNSNRHRSGATLECVLMSTPPPPPPHATNPATINASSSGARPHQAWLSVASWRRDCGGVMRWRQQWWRRRTPPQLRRHWSNTTYQWGSSPQQLQQVKLQFPTNLVWSLNITLLGECSQSLMSTSGGGGVEAWLGGVLLATTMTVALSQ